MKDIFKLFVNNELPCGGNAVQTKLDTLLSEAISQLEDCFKQKTPKFSNTEVLERVDNIVEICTKISEQRFIDGMKIGIAMASESQQYINELERKIEKE